MANSTERIGVYHCGEIAESNNWMFREQPINDMASRASVQICRLDNIQHFVLIPYSPYGLRTYRLRWISYTATP